MFVQKGGVGEEVMGRIVTVTGIATVVCCSLSVFFALVFFLFACSSNCKARSSWLLPGYRDFLCK